MNAKMVLILLIFAYLLFISTSEATLPASGGRYSFKSELRPPYSISVRTPSSGAETSSSVAATLGSSNRLASDDSGGGWSPPEIAKNDYVTKKVKIKLPDLSELKIIYEQLKTKDMDHPRIYGPQINKENDNDYTKFFLEIFASIVIISFLIVFPFYLTEKVD